MKLFVLVIIVIISRGYGTTCVRPKRTTRKTCLNPPVVRRLDLSSYTGRWFNTFVSGTARRFGNGCATANYTLTPDNTVSVLNCNFESRDLGPACLEGVATPIRGLPTSRLEVSFDPRTPPGPYNVVALLGRRNYGYFAAAVYSCRIVHGAIQEGFFIIVRTPFAPKFVLRKIKRRLRCQGYLLEDEFVPIEHNRKCQYFDGSAGFKTFDVSAFPPLPINTSF